MWIKIVLASLIACSAHADPIRVAIIDTGLDVESSFDTEPIKKLGLVKPVMCPEGGFDFTSKMIFSDEVPKDVTDTHGHGTHVAGLIAKGAGNIPYCIIPMKYWDKDKFFQDVQKSTIRAFEKAISLKVDIINYSAGGNERSEKECLIVKKALDSGIIVVAAAGNENSNINDKPYYPAMCDERIVAVENIDVAGDPTYTSNFTDSRDGAKDLEKEKATNVISILPKNKTGPMSGTSQAAAIMTGNLVKRLFLMRNDKYLKIISKKSELNLKSKYEYELMKAREKISIPKKAGK